MQYIQLKIHHKYEDIIRVWKQNMFFKFLENSASDQDGIIATINYFPSKTTKHWAKYIKKQFSRDWLSGDKE